MSNAPEILPNAMGVHLHFLLGANNPFGTISSWFQIHFGPFAQYFSLFLQIFFQLFQIAWNLVALDHILCTHAVNRGQYCEYCEIFQCGTLHKFAEIHCKTLPLYPKLPDIMLILLYDIFCSFNLDRGIFGISIYYSYVL